MYIRGLSTRDIEEALRDQNTGRLLLSKDEVSELNEELILFTHSPKQKKDINYLNGKRFYNTKNYEVILWAQ